MRASSNGKIERNQRAKKLLERVGLGHRLDHRPTEMSGGEQQRAAIARALINNPRIVLADEPTGNLDSSIGAEVMKLLRELNAERGVTLIIVTHDPDVAAFADRIVHLRDGEISEIETLEDPTLELGTATKPATSPETKPNGSLAFKLLFHFRQDWCHHLAWNAFFCPEINHRDHPLDRHVIEFCHIGLSHRRANQESKA